MRKFSIESNVSGEFLYCNEAVLDSNYSSDSSLEISETEWVVPTKVRDLNEANAQ
jgi:hypothetical protein